MGCLRNIIKIIILILAVIGFISIGGREFLNKNVIPVVKNFSNNFMTELQLRNKAPEDLSLKDIKDISKLSAQKSLKNETQIVDGYEISTVKGLMGYDAEIAQHIESGQKMIIVNTNNKIKVNLSEPDKSKLKHDLLKIATKQKKSPIKFDDIEIIEQGKWSVSGIEQNYVILTLKDKVSDKDIKAIISSPDKENSKMFITFAPVENFSTDIAKSYWK